MIKPESLVLPTVAALHPYEPGKPIEELQRELGIDEPVKLASNENPLVPSPLAVAAMRAALAEVNRYPDGSCWAVCQKIAAHHQVSPDQIFMARRSVEVLQLARVPVFAPGPQRGFLRACVRDLSRWRPRLRAARPERADEATAFYFDLDAIAAAIDAQTRIVFLGNPTNPDRHDRQARRMGALPERVPEHVVIVADEAYFEFVRDPKYPDSLQVSRPQRMIVTMRTFSKIFGLAGVRVGYAVARPDLVQLLHKVRQPFNVTSLAQAGVIAGMDDAEHVRRTLANNAEGVGYLERELKRLGLAYVPSHANFILTDVGDGNAVFNRLLKLGVIVRPMGAYGWPRHVRISVGLPEENRRLVEGLERIEKTPGWSAESLSFLKPHEVQTSLR